MKGKEHVAISPDTFTFMYVLSALSIVFPKRQSSICTYDPVDSHLKSSLYNFSTAHCTSS